jgi:predicted Rossmann fold flavoprotein
MVPVALKDNWVKNLSGVTLQDIKLNVVQDGKRHDSRSGRLLFTHFGISGPTVLNLSSKIGDLLQYGEVIVELDLLPDLDHTALKAELYELLATDNNKKIKNSLGKLIASSLVDPVLIEADVDGEKANNSITREERVRLIQLMKAMPMHVQKLLGADKAIVSSGGVKIEEVNFQTMESRLIPGLYVVGDVLNIDRPSGGYSLQLCWATGFVAGNNC